MIHQLLEFDTFEPLAPVVLFELPREADGLVREDSGTLKGLDQLAG